MRLTLHTDYALRALIYMAVKNDRLVSIKEISDSYEISECHMIKVIHRLGKGGFIKTVRGNRGGICLARPAEEICLGEVIRFTEEDMSLVACASKNGTTPHCLLIAGCKLKGAMNEAIDAFIAVFDKLTLHDVVTPFERLKINKAEEKRALKLKAISVP